MCILTIFQYTAVIAVEITANTGGKEGEDSKSTTHLLAFNLEPQGDL